MVLRKHIDDREFDKFVLNDDNETAVRTVGEVSGTIKPSGLNIGGLVTEQTINPTTWTALPLSPLANRNALAIQNQSGQEIKINYSSGQAGYVGMIIANGSERTYDITDAIVIYAKSSSSVVTINVEELA